MQENMEEVPLKWNCVEKEEREIASSFMKEHSADIFFICSEINQTLCDRFIDFIIGKKKAENIALFLSTAGGDVDAAYRIIRFLRKKYKRLILYVFGYCKSAGTLFALGADEIVMGPRGEFGPLDVQVYSPDEFLQRSSGLSISQSLESITQKSFEAFEDMFLKIRQKSNGVITTQTASDIAAKIATGLFAPITKQIDSTRIGELQRFLDVVQEYGVRLGADANVVNFLTTKYPSHSFVIDRDEAKVLFPDIVRNPDIFEDAIRNNLTAYSRNKFRSDFTRYMLHRKNIIGTLEFDDQGKTSKQEQRQRKGEKSTNENNNNKNRKNKQQKKASKASKLGSSKTKDRKKS